MKLVVDTTYYWRIKFVVASILQPIYTVHMTPRLKVFIMCKFEQNIDVSKAITQWQENLNVLIDFDVTCNFLHLWYDP